MGSQSIGELAIFGFHVDEHEGVQIGARRRPVRYLHMLLDRHAVLLVDGLAVESLFPGDLALAAMAPQARASLETALTDLVRRNGPYGPLARPAARRHEARAALAALVPLRAA